MRIIYKLLLVLLFVGLIVPKASLAFDLREVFTSGDSIVVRVRERIEYFFAFRVENKVEVLEKQAERRLETAQNSVENGNNSKVLNLLQNYLQIKGRQDDLLDDVDEGIIGGVKEKTLGQQIIMEGIKGKVDGEMKQGVMRIQEQVVNQVAQRVIEVNGKEGQTEFLNNVGHVWAPGTGPGGEGGTTFAPGTSAGGNGGVVIVGGSIQFAPGTSVGESGVKYDGGAGQQFAPGTSGGGNSGSDIKNVEVVEN